LKSIKLGFASFDEFLGTLPTFVPKCDKNLQMVNHVICHARCCGAAHPKPRSHLYEPPGEDNAVFQMVARIDRVFPPAARKDAVLLEQIRVASKGEEEGQPDWCLGAKV
jgi:hypothetical protein